jgi:hypothetical protein
LLLVAKPNNNRFRSNQLRLLLAWLAHTLMIAASSGTPRHRANLSRQDQTPPMACGAVSAGFCAALRFTHEITGPERRYGFAL